MTKIDIVTGLLGAGKTEFIKKYARYLLKKGERICILENDFGAINVDMEFLKELESDACAIEMIIGGDGRTAHRRRFKTKLIQMGMEQYDRVLVEPSGVFDMDEFFDILYEEPLDRWYQIGTEVTIVDAGLPQKLPPAYEYLLASEAANAGCILFSKTKNVSEKQMEEVQEHLNRALKQIKCNRQFGTKEIRTKDWEQYTAEDYEKIENSGFCLADFEKKVANIESLYESLFFFSVTLSEKELEKRANTLFLSPDTGHIIRMKGFVKAGQTYLRINATSEKIEITPAKNGQDVLILIGAGLNKNAIETILTKQ